MIDKIKQFRDERSRLNERILAPENNSAIMKRIYGLDTFSYMERNTGLSAKQKEIIGLATSMVLRCDDCIKYHLEKCYELGVANDEMMDIFGIANLVGGTIVIPHTRRAIEYWELLNQERPNPSPFAKSFKDERYRESVLAINSVLEGVRNPISKMATIIEVLKSKLPYYYWVGFYLVEGKRLTVGPYQGTHGCLYIDFGKGVCGRAAETEKTIIVDDIEALNKEQQSSKGVLHVTCDPRCQSEIVVPVFGSDDELIAVFDVDSLHKQAFDDIDQKYLEEIMRSNFKN
ncbi:MAG: carboxymuconolactone decarboxylase family protein [Bacteroidales bacterium]|nr:carboxymuconolactone decarboxylase family protein [Bacteroidales bacterium]